MDFSDSPITIGSQVLNAIDGNGTRWRVTSFQGWGATDPTSSLTQRVRNSGAWAGDSFSSGRTMTISLLVTSLTASQHSLDIDQLIHAVAKTDTLFQVSESGRVRYCYARRASQVVPEKQNAWTSRFVFSMFSKDWRKFSAPLVGSTLLPMSTGGLTIPYTVPYPINSTFLSGQVSLTNPGNETGPVKMRVDGPTTGPIITHVGSAQALTFSASLVLAAGEWLDIDMEKHTVLANGQSSRAGYITSRGWSGFDPGPNTWSFTAASYNAASLLTVTGTPADE